MSRGPAEPGTGENVRGGRGPVTFDARLAHPATEHRKDEDMENGCA